MTVLPQQLNPSKTKFLELKKWEIKIKEVKLKEWTGKIRNYTHKMK